MLLPPIQPRALRAAARLLRALAGSVTHLADLTERASERPAPGTDDPEQPQLTETPTDAGPEQSVATDTDGIPPGSAADTGPPAHWLARVRQAQPAQWLEMTRQGRPNVPDPRAAPRPTRAPADPERPTGLRGDRERPGEPESPRARDADGGPTTPQRPPHSAAGQSSPASLQPDARTEPPAEAGATQGDQRRDTALAPRTRARQQPAEDGGQPAPPRRARRSTPVAAKLGASEPATPPPPAARPAEASVPAARPPVDLTAQDRQPPTDPGLHEQGARAAAETRRPERAGATRVHAEAPAPLRPGSARRRPLPARMRRQSAGNLRATGERVQSPSGAPQSRLARPAAWSEASAPGAPAVSEAQETRSAANAVPPRAAAYAGDAGVEWAGPPAHTGAHYGEHSPDALVTSIRQAVAEAVEQALGGAEDRRWPELPQLGSLPGDGAPALPATDRRRAERLAREQRGMLWSEWPF